MLSPKLWPCEERAAAVRLHEVFDGGVLLRFAAEDLGDDAFHFAAVAAVDEAGAPGDERVAGDDQAGQFAQPALHQLARDDRRAVRAAELGPGNDAGHHQPHRAGGVRAERHAAEIQAVVGDREAVAARRREQVLGRHAEVAEDDAAIVRVLERPQAVLAELEVFVLLRRQLDDEHGRLALDQAHQADRAAGHDIRDEQLFAVDDVVDRLRAARWCAEP